MLLAVLFDFGLFFPLFLGLDRPELLVLFVQVVDILPVLHVLGPPLPLLLLLFHDGSLGLHLEQLPLFHLVLVLVDVLLDNLLVLLFEGFLKLLELLLLFFLPPSLLLVTFLDLVLDR